jgi:hypothetical protein
MVFVCIDVFWTPVLFCLTVPIIIPKLSCPHGFCPSIGPPLSPWSVRSRMDYMLFDVPHADIRLLDKPYTTDVLSKFTFRHEIGVPEGFFPDAWMRKKLRSRAKAPGTEEMENGDEFKRKEAREKILKEVE